MNPQAISLPLFDSVGSTESLQESSIVLTWFEPWAANEPFRDASERYRAPAAPGTSPVASRQQSLAANSTYLSCLAILYQGSLSSGTHNRSRTPPGGLSSFLPVPFPGASFPIAMVTARSIQRVVETIILRNSMIGNYLGSCVTSRSLLRSFDISLGRRRRQWPPRRQVS